MTGPDEILHFWFGDLDGGFADDAHRKSWFTPDPVRDAEIGERFGHLLTAALEGGLDAWPESPRSALALVIVCDQFSRQIHRGSREAYATDPLALKTSRLLVERGDDQDLALDERAFLYMPFQHAESRVDQHTAVGLYIALHDAAPAARRRLAGGYLRHARQHRDIVLRFGRFPHRNGVLGRISSDREREFLATASDFGQRSRK